MSTTVTVNEVPQFALSITEQNGARLTLTEDVAPQLTVALSGPAGPTGPTGPTGAVGPGVAAGGSAGQVLSKQSATNYDTEWVDTAEDAVPNSIPIRDSLGNTGVVTNNGEVSTSPAVPLGTITYDSGREALFVAVEDGVAPNTTIWRKLPVAPFGDSIVPVFIQDSAPSLPSGVGLKFLWRDTADGDLQIKYDDGT